VKRIVAIVISFIMMANLLVLFGFANVKVVSSDETFISWKQRRFF